MSIILEHVNVVLNGNNVMHKNDVVIDANDVICALNRGILLYVPTLEDDMCYNRFEVKSVALVTMQCKLKLYALLCGLCAMFSAVTTL